MKMNATKSYTHPNGTVYTVDKGIPDSILDRLNALPHLTCRSTCSGGHITHMTNENGTNPRPMPKAVRRDGLRKALFERVAHVAFEYKAMGTPLPRLPKARYRVFTELAGFTPPVKTGKDTILFTAIHEMHIFAPKDSGKASIKWWKELCQALELVTTKSKKVTRS